MAQRSSTTAFAKSTRPEIGGVVRRDALFTRLDGNAERTVAWVAAPPGYGKTTLAATYLEARSYRWAWYEIDRDDDDAENFFHYLTHATRRLTDDNSELPTFSQEHRSDLAAFSRRYFRALFAAVKEPTALVLDNLHELGVDGDLRAILESGLSQVPRQCCVIVTSREAPPVSLARLQAGGQLVCLLADELKIKPGEVAELARLRGHVLAEPLVQELHDRADGWAAALVLMVEHLKLGDSRAASHADITPRAVFDYLAGEIFDRFEPSMQRLLLHVACLPRVTIEIARALSRDDGAARVLLNLAHNDYFVRELVGADGRVFIFHPLLREFLLQRAARELPEAVSPQTRKRAARLLRDSGQIEDALALFVECKEWDEAAAIALAHSDALLRQCRHATLATWLESLPPDSIAADGALLTAYGGALAQISPRAARRKYEEAFAVFQRGDDRRGMIRACLGVIDAVLREFDDLTALDRWLGEFDRLELTLRKESVPPTVIAARLWRNPTHPSIVTTGQGADGDLGEGRALVLTAAALLNGEFARAAAIADRFEGNDPAARLALLAAQALRRVLDGDSTGALEVAHAGLAISEADGLHVHDTWLHMLCAAAHLGQGDLSAAALDLALVEGRPARRRGDRAFAHYLRGSLARAAHRSGESLRESKNAILLAVEVGLPWLEGLARIATAQLLLEASDRPGAEAQMRSAESVAARLDNPLLRLACQFTQAALALAADDEAGLCLALPQALNGSRELGVHHVPGVPASLIASLCAEALRRGMTIEHTRLLIAAGRLAPPEGAQRLRRWPWRFEITTLGPFALRRDSEPIEFSAKGPGRPVELLKVLIALGGIDVRVDILADALWPHVDADYAHKSFTATLHRLRRILDEDDSIRMRDGRLSLNPALFWTDSWALDQLLADIEQQSREPQTSMAAAESPLVDEALALYGGPFLLDDVEQPAYIARREQLRARLMRMLARMGRQWEDAGHGEMTVDAYLRCIDADEQCEAFYRNLMICYQRHGNGAEALVTYSRLRAVLAARLKTTPSPETESIRAALQP